MNRHRVWSSPVGELTLVVDEQGVLAGIYLPGQRHLPSEEFLGDRDDTIAGEAVRQLTEYFAGQRQRFTIELADRGTAFQQQVWAALREIGYGATRTYGELAAELGRPSAARAVGAATGRNPWSIVVPCHRLVARDGSLHGYAGGLAAKEFLLHHEQQARPLLQDLDAARRS
jgi:methylated-DNA-[protein]-cysteine S-methyltransferase